MVWMVFKPRVIYPQHCRMLFQPLSEGKCVAGVSLHSNMQRFQADFASEAVAQEIKHDMDEARTLGARGVPTFFINGQELTGARPFEQFKALIDALLPAARRAGGKGRIAAVEVLQLDDSGWTDLERRVIVEYRWWALAELRTTGQTVYPEELADLLTELLTGR